MEKRRLTLRASLTILLLVFVTIYLYIFQWGGLERFITEGIAYRLNRFVVGSNTSVSLGDISGGLFGSFTIEDFSISARHGDSLSFRMTTGTLSAGYSLGDLTEDSLRFDAIELDSLVVWVRSDSSGHLALPQLRDNFDGSSSAAFVVEQLTVRNATIIVQSPDDSLVLRELNMTGALRLNFGGRYSADISDMSYLSGPDDSSKNIVSCRIMYSEGSLVVED